MTHVFVNDHALYQCSLLQFSPDLPIHLDQFKVHVPTFQVRYGEKSFHCNLSHVALTTVDAGERGRKGGREGGERVGGRKEGKKRKERVKGSEKGWEEERKERREGGGSMYTKELRARNNK